LSYPARGRRARFAAAIASLASFGRFRGSAAARVARLRWVALVQKSLAMALCDGGLRQGGTRAGFVSLDGLFAGRHFDREIIILCVRVVSRGVV
jgi:hypothetical protein